MDKIFITLFEALINGGHSAIISLLVIFIAYLLWDRINLIKNMKEQSKDYKGQLEVILDKYHQGQIGLIEAFNEIKLILAKLEGRL